MEDSTDFESFCESMQVLSRRKDLLGQDTPGTTGVPEAAEREMQEQSTTTGDVESMQANKLLIRKIKTTCIQNDTMFEKIEPLQKQPNVLFSQKTQVTSSGSETSSAIALADKQNEIPKTENKEAQAEAVHSSAQLQALDVQLKSGKVLQDGLQSRGSSGIREEQNFWREPCRPSLWKRFVRLFVPGWRSRYSSRETVEYMEAGERAREERPLRSLWQERLTHFCRRRRRIS